MAVGGLVEGGGNDLGFDGALHVGYLLGALVDEEHHEVDLGVVESYGVGDLLEECGLTGLGLSHDEAALAFSDRCEEVDDACGESLLGMACEFELLVGEERGHGLEGMRSRMRSGARPLISRNFTIGKNLSPSRGGRTVPRMVSPLLRP